MPMDTDGKIKILLVEDNHDHAFLIKRALEKNSPYYFVKTVPDVEKCLDEVQKEKFSIIISDYKLQGSTGLKLMSELKERKIELPIIMLTGSGNEEIAVRAMKEGAYDYVIKEPDYLRTIHLVVKKALERHRDKLEKERLESDLIKKALELEEANKKLAVLSITDGLTEIYNYRYLTEVLGTECERAKRTKNFLSCFIIDVDFFKNVNDQFGHPAGDYILQQLSKIFMTNLRRIDTVGRYGGDEFIFILPDTTAVGAEIVADKLRRLVENRIFIFEGQSIKITISIGISTFAGKRNLTKELLIKSADEALYMAKHNGRNRIEVIGQQ